MKAWMVLGGCALTIAVATLASLAYERGPRAVAPEPEVEPVTVRLFRDPVPTPSLTLKTLDGRTLRTEDLRGKVVLVNFWATWCPPCRAEIPDLVALQERYREHLVIVGISQDEGPTDGVSKFVAEHKVNYPIVMTTPDVEKAFPGVTGLPTTFVLDTDGFIVQKHIGLLNADTAERETRVLAGLAPGNVERVEPEQAVGLENAAQAREIPGVDLTTLSPELRATTLQRLNAEPCTCGCGLTVARCRVDDPTCSVSLPRAQTIAAEVASGQGKAS
ncbi:MAG: TlpA family protein disulfide reductase [Vicinamibacterales bacterium]